MTSLPTGLVTFLFTDIVDSSRLWEEHSDAMRAAMQRHDALVEEHVRRHGGTVVRPRGEGDSRFAVFARATDAVTAACAIQRALLVELWPTPTPIRIRMALHTGEGVLSEGDYYGPAVNRCARIRAVAHRGQTLLSLATAELVRDSLPEGISLRALGMHRLKDLQRPEHLVQLLHPDLPVEFPPLQSLDEIPNNLPAQLTSFIGRERESAEVKRCLSAARLLTLTGTAGCGKTRLALQVAADLLEEFADGVWLVELAPLSDPAAVPQVLASAVGVREQQGQSLLASVTDFLKPKRVLVVLDNCEHLVSACEQLADALLRACPKLVMLVTSREPLGTPGEMIWRVPSLSLPDLGETPSHAQLLQYEAIRLFVERASASQPRFEVTRSNGPALVGVCHRLDGIPLAIELAAARVKVLTVEQIAARLDDRFRLLTGGSPRALSRHQTLRATLDWSYSLLSEEERVLFRRLSVFAGGWTLDVAEAICSEDGIEVSNVLDLLTRLVDKSLVMAEPQGAETRYRMLETIRQYSSDKLTEAGEVGKIRGRHLHWFLQLTEQAEPDLSGPRKEMWLKRLEMEHDNLRAALEWSREEAGDREAGLRLVGALPEFWNAHGHLTEGREWLTVLLRENRDASNALRAKALSGAGFLATLQGDLSAAQGLLTEGLVLQREVGDTQGVAYSINRLGRVAEAEGDYERASTLYEESLGLFRELGDRDNIARLLSNMGYLAWSQGHFAKAQALLEESLGMDRASGNKWGIALALNRLGLVAAYTRDFQRAASYYEESLALFRELAAKYNIGIVLNNLGDLALRQGDPEPARALLEQSMALLREARAKPVMLVTLLNLGYVEVHEGEYERAARVFGAWEALSEAIHASPLPCDRADHERAVSAVRAVLGETSSRRLWSEGRAMAMEQAIQEALKTPSPRHAKREDSERLNYDTQAHLEGPRLPNQRYH